MWIAERINECAPLSTRGSAGVEDLLRAALFFEGKASQVFGMAAQLNSMPGAEDLHAACLSALRKWFDEFATTDPAAQVNLYEVARRHGLPLQLPEPASIKATRELEQQRDSALAQFGCLSDSLADWRSLWTQLEALRAVGARVPFCAVTKFTAQPKSLDISQFEWLNDTWAAVAKEGIEPAFLPIAGADGDYLGILLDSELRTQQVDPPVVYYSHEHDPVYSWVFESCATAERVFLAAEAKRPRRRALVGVEHPQVKELLREMNASTPTAGMSTRAWSRRWLWGEDIHHDISTFFEEAGNGFAVRNLAVQAVWRSFDEKLSALEPARS